MLTKVIGSKSAKTEKPDVGVIDISLTNIERKTLNMSETLKKYPRPARTK